MSLLQKDHLDLQQGGDTGQANTDAIQPIVDGEGASQTTFRRPSENLRGRTEEIRELAQDLIYYRDNNHMVIEGATGHTVTWPGVSTGIIAQSGDLTIRPLLTPPSSTKGSLDIGTNGVDRVTYSAGSTAYATMGLNAVTIEHRDGGVSATHACTITDGPVKRILVVFDDADTSHDSAATKVLVDAAVALDSDLVGYLDVTDNGAGGTSIEIQAETALEGTADQEAHLISSGLLDTLTTTTPLIEGAAIGIWYPYVVEPVPTTPTFGGRQESNPDRTTHVIPIGSLFVTTVDPQKIPGAVPLCKVVNDELVFFDGSRFVAGASGPMGTASNVYIDDSAFQGPPTLAIAGGIRIPAATAQAALDFTDQRLGELRSVTYTCSDGTASFGGDYDGVSALDSANSAIGGTGGVLFLRKGTYTVPNSFVLGTNVRVIGEAGVLITQAAGVSFALSIGSHLEHVAVTTAAVLSVANGVTGVVIRAANITAALTLAGDGAYLENVSVIAGTTTNTVSGDANVFINCDFDGHVNVTGDRNTFTVGSITSTSSPSPLLRVGGDSNQITGTRLGPDSGTRSLVEVSGGGNSFQGVHAEVTTLLTSAPVVNLAPTTINTRVNSFTDCLFQTQTGVVLGFVGATEIAKAIFTNCTFKNLTATLSQYVLTCATADLQWHEVLLQHCTVDTSGQEGHSVISTPTTGGVAVAWKFHDCTIKYGASGVRASSELANTEFLRCNFFLENTVTGVIAGVASGFSNPLWFLSSAGTGRPSRMEDCRFDMGDYEVEINTTDPEYTGRGMILALSDSTAKNIVFTNVNRHVDFQGIGSYVDVQALGVLDNAKWEFTATAGTGGTRLVSQFISMTADQATVRNLYLDSQPDAGNRYVRAATTGGAGIAEALIEDCTFLGDISQGVVFVGTGFTNLKYRRCQNGDSQGTRTSSRPVLPAGVNVTFTGNSYYMEVTNQLFDLSAMTSLQRATVVDCVFINFTTTAPASVACIYSFGITATLIMNGCIIDMLDTSPAARDLFSGATALTAIMSGNQAYLVNAGSAPGGAGVTLLEANNW